MNKLRLLVLPLVFLMMALIGCSSDGDGQVPNAGRSTTSEACDRLAEVEPPAGAGITVLVPDSTASHAVSGLSNAVRDSLAQAQQRGDKLQIIPVDGAGATRSVVRTVALEPAPGDDSAEAKDARPAILACVEQWAYDDLTRPTKEGSALLDALGAAARQKPNQIIVLSDGVSNVGQLDLNTVGFDASPALAAEQLSQAQALEPELAEKSLLWSGIAQTATPLPQPARTNLERIWTEIFKVARTNVSFDKQTGTRREPAKDLPQDLVKVPETTTIALPCRVEVQVPAVLLFAGESALLADDVDGALAGARNTLREWSDSVARVDGHAAAYGDISGRYRKSEERAVAVRDRLVSYGFDAARFTVRGLGSDSPLVNEFPGGRHDEAAAARNRRVVIDISRTGCDR